MNVVERSHVADHLWVWRVRLSESLGTTTMGDEVEHQVSLLVLYRNKLKTYKVVVVAGSSVSYYTKAFQTSIAAYLPFGRYSPPPSPQQ